MKKLLATTMLMCSLLANANADTGNTKPLLDKIAFQVTGKQWVSTQTALLSVSVYATLNNSDLVKARNEVMKNLNEIAGGEWHLTQFDRSQDSSGLEKLTVRAQARVNQSLLTNVYQNAKSVSKPGATYSVNNIEFKPSLEEVEQSKDKLRAQLYQQVNDEMARINKAYANQHYTLSQLVFVEGNGSVEPRMMEAKMSTLNYAASPAPAIAVSNELIMTAVVVAANNRAAGG